MQQGLHNHYKYFWIFVIVCFAPLVVQAQFTIPTALEVENTYNLKPVIGAQVAVQQKESDGKYYTFGTYYTDSLGITNLSLNKGKTYTIITKKENYYTQITVLSTEELSRIGKNKFGLSMRPKDCYRLRGKVEKSEVLAGENYLVLKNLKNNVSETVAINQEGYYFACGTCGQSYLVIPYLDGKQQKMDTIELHEETCQGKRNPLLELNITPQEARIDSIENTPPQGKYAKGDSLILKDLVFEGKTKQLNDVGGAALDLLYQNLVENPKLIVELRVHTDARKSERYNWLLAKKRGAFIEQYLSEKGVTADRFTIVAVGESEIMNHCTNGKSCSKQEHAANNRVEMRVLQGDKDFLD